MYRYIDIDTDIDTDLDIDTKTYTYTDKSILYLEVQATSNFFELYCWASEEVYMHTLYMYIEGI